MNKEKTYQSINHRINQSVRQYRIPYTVGKDAALNSILERIRDTKDTPQKSFLLPYWIKSVAAAAAVVFVLVSAGWVLSNQNIGNPGENAVSHRLPDQSRVMLAEGSTLKYNRFFQSRKVHLSGKAYFEVQKGNRFQVTARNGRVEVLGTRFTIDDRNGRLEVVCFEGKVRATYNQQEIVLGEGAGVNFSENQEKEPVTIQESYPPMALFSEIYSNSELDGVLKDLGSFFGVTIINQVGKERFFSGTLNTGSLETALEIISASLEIRYKKQVDQSIIVF